MMTLERWLLAAMLLSISGVALALLWDEHNEFEASVERLREEQMVLASAVGADFEARLAQYEEEHEEGRDSELVIPRLLGGSMALERPRWRIFLLSRPGHAGLLTTSGRAITSLPLQEALQARASSALVSREESARLGFPERLSMAGIARATGHRGTWGVVVLTSGERLRAREQNAQLRFLLGLGVVTVLVLGFGGLALRQQRRRLQYARELEVAALERDRDRLLARADKMVTLAALSSGIAHEVATPLGTITARVEQVLATVEDNARATSALRVVLDQVERIQRVIRGVLALARGELPPRAVAEPRSIVQAAVDLVKHRLGEAGVSVDVDVAHELSPLACDRTLLEQALANLLLNACDASPRGGQVRVSAHDERDALTLVVVDEGEGISPETAARARDAFFTTKPSGQGSGLGLAIVHEIVSSHGGSLTLAQREDARGTRATLRLVRS